MSEMRKRSSFGVDNTKPGEMSEIPQKQYAVLARHMWKSVSTCLTVGSSVPRNTSTSVAIDQISACSTIQAGSWKALINVWRTGQQYIQWVLKYMCCSLLRIPNRFNTQQIRMIFTHLSHSECQCTLVHIHKCSHWPYQCMFLHSNMELRSTHQCLQNKKKSRKAVTAVITLFLHTIYIFLQNQQKTNRNEFGCQHMLDVFANLSHSECQCTQEHIHKCSHWPYQCMFLHSNRELRGTHQCLKIRKRRFSSCACNQFTKQMFYSEITLASFQHNVSLICSPVSQWMPVYPGTHPQV